MAASVATLVEKPHVLAGNLPAMGSVVRLVSVDAAVSWSITGTSQASPVPGSPSQCRHSRMYLGENIEHAEDEPIALIVSIFRG
jgi:hypothetical protein